MKITKIIVYHGGTYNYPYQSTSAEPNSEALSIQTGVTLEAEMEINDTSSPDQGASLSEMCLSINDSCRDSALRHEDERHSEAPSKRRSQAKDVFDGLVEALEGSEGDLYSGLLVLKNWIKDLENNPF